MAGQLPLEQHIFVRIGAPEPGKENMGGRNIVNGMDRDTGEGLMLVKEKCPGCSRFIFQLEEECPICHWERPGAKERAAARAKKFRPPIIDKNGVHFK